MKFEDCIEMLEPVVANQRQEAWIELGCGSGLFTAALVHVLQPGSQIVALDLDTSSFQWHRIPYQRQLEVKLIQQKAETFRPSFQVDGILMANFLHYIENQPKFIAHISKWLKPDGVIVCIEYDLIEANPWIPYPISLPRAKQLFKQAGFNTYKHLGTFPSRYDHIIYGIATQRKLKSRKPQSEIHSH